MYQTLQIERRGPIEYLTLNRPDVRNAFNEVMIAELTQWAAATANARDVRVVVIAGAGKVFSAGADLIWMSTQVNYSQDENQRDAAAAAGMFNAIDTLPVPLIGRIHGAALGGGAGLAAVCDVVVADDQAVFGFTEVKLGILPAVISPFALAKVPGRHDGVPRETQSRMEHQRVILQMRRGPSAFAKATVDRRRSPPASGGWSWSVNS
jgi:methylglutaconyl-CoA hydratase